MKILVTGTAGFIGYHLAKKLLERGDEVVGLDNINDYYDVNLKYARLNELGIDCRASLAVTESSHCEKRSDKTPIIASETPVIASETPVIASEAKQSINLPPDRSTAPYRIYNIGNNSPVQLLDFIKTLEKAIGKEATKNFMDMQDGDVVSTYADVSDLINDFGYKPDTSLEVGIERFVKWYKNFYGEGK